MAFWKQALISLVIIAVAAIGWARYYPGAEDQLARWGLDWLPFASTGSPAGGPQTARGPGGPAGLAGRSRP